jgi:catalase
MTGSPDTPRSRTFPTGALAAIALIVLSGAIAFIYTAGWLSPERLTPARMVEALANRGGDPTGHRRNHAKGICFTGEFDANGAGAALSTAPMFAAGNYPVVGRFAIAVGDPRAADAVGRVRSMAVRIRAGGEEWRSGMNNSPVFAVSTPLAFYQLTRAQAVDPSTGKANPALVRSFFDAHPESAAFMSWAAIAPWSSSFADQKYNSLNAFRFIDGAGHTRMVRWSMQPTASPGIVPKQTLSALPADFLEQDLVQRLAAGELRWHLVVTVAAPGDSSSDSTQAWPVDREQIDVGVLVVQQAQQESDGACRDTNFDPTILPTGIQPSDDPLLAARSAAYAKSFDLRMSEAHRVP